jgi:iron(III) transport system substrate-binding protein
MDQLYEAAKKEGKVVIQTPAGAGYRPAIDAFMKAFPGIEADQQAYPDAATYLPKIQGERQAGIYSIDVLNTTVTPLLQFLKPGGSLDPIKPLIVLPEILDDKVWYSGIESRYADTAKTHVFRHQVTVLRPIYVNTNLIKEDELKTIDDLLDPKWKGKIVTSDLVQGYIYTPSTVLRETKGEAWLRKLFVDQEPQIVRDRRQAIETLVRGGAPIGFGLHPVVMGDFVRDGLAGHIKNPDVEGGTYGGGDVIAIYNKAPHPAAAKLYINWLLTKAGQAAHSAAVGQNSARLDVPVVDPATAPAPGSKVTDPSNEEWISRNAETQEFLKGLRG